MVLDEEIKQAEEQEGEAGGPECRPPPRRGLEDALEAGRGRGEAHLGDAHGVRLGVLRTGKKTGPEFFSFWLSKKKKKREEISSASKKSYHRVQKPVLRLHLAVDARSHRPQGPDALAQGVDAAVVVALEGLWVDLLYDFLERSRLRKKTNGLDTCKQSLSNQLLEFFTPSSSQIALFHTDLLLRA